MTFGKKKYRTGGGGLLGEEEENHSLLSSLLHAPKFPKLTTPIDVTVSDEGDLPVPNFKCNCVYI